MTNQEIKDRAPDGATHYEIDGNQVYYYKFKNGFLRILSSNGKWTLKPIDWLKDAKPLH